MPPTNNHYAASPPSPETPNDRRALTPVVLLLLRQGPAHGYELLGRLQYLTPAADPATNTGTLYRLLRSLEAAGALTSSWEGSRGGPSRRVYSITAEGRRELDLWVDWIERDAKAKRRFLREYRATEPRASASRR